MTVVRFPKRPEPLSPAESLILALEYLQREAEEIGLTETAFLIGISMKSIQRPKEH